MTEVTDCTLIEVEPTNDDEIEKIMEVASRNRSGLRVRVGLGLGGR